jgi:hypothetical protein
MVTVGAPFAVNAKQVRLRKSTTDNMTTLVLTRFNDSVDRFYVLSTP